MNRHRSAFTLIEIMVTTVLLALFMSSAFAVVASIGRARSTIERHDRGTAFTADPLQLIAWDIANAHAARTENQKLLLIGYGAIDFTTGERGHRPVEVCYSVRSDGKRPWLVRTQRNIGDLTNRAFQTLAVAADVSSFQIDVGSAPVAERLRHIEVPKPLSSRDLRLKLSRPAPQEVKPPYVTPRDPATLNARPLGNWVTVTLGLDPAAEPRQQTVFYRSTAKP